MESRSKQTSPSLILASICDHPKLVIRNKQISVESVSNTEPNTSIGQCHPICASEDQRQELEALQGSATCTTGTHQPFPDFPVTWHGGAASAESICRPAQNVSLYKRNIQENQTSALRTVPFMNMECNHEKPCAIRAFSPKLQEVRTPPLRGKTGTLTLREQSKLLSK